MCMLLLGTSFVLNLDRIALKIFSKWQDPVLRPILPDRPFLLKLEYIHTDKNSNTWKDGAIYTRLHFSINNQDSIAGVQ